MNLRLRTQLSERARFRASLFALIAANFLFLGSQTAEQIPSPSTGTLDGIWTGTIESLDNGEPSMTFLELHQQGSSVTGSVAFLGYTVQLKGTLENGRFVLYRPDRKLPFVEGEMAGKNLSYKVYGKHVDAHPETDAEKPEPIVPLPLPSLKPLVDNGLAKTPPMGWNSWNKFHSKIDDASVREIADAMVSSGMRDAGYVYLNIDDSWEGVPDQKGVLQSNHKFPDMKALADYVHARGLKLGIYSSPGMRTCLGYPASYGHEEVDARTWARWGIDYVKYDWCSAGKIYKVEDVSRIYQKMGSALASSGRPMVYSLCEYGMGDVQKWGAQVSGNLWRTTGDIRDDWPSVVENGFSQNDLAAYAGPGHWNDPDMLEVGNGHMSAEEYRSHMSLWSLLAAPLLAGNDLRTMSSETKSILMNSDVIAIDQDSLGKQGTRLSRSGDVEVWKKPLADGGIAIGLFNLGEVATQATVDISKLKLSGQLVAMDLWTHAATPLKVVYETTLPKHGVRLLRINAAKYARPSLLSQRLQLRNQGIL